MEKKYLLPLLKKDVPVDNDDCWEEQDRIYDFLLENLKLYYEPIDSVFDGNSRAIPHMYEQMLVFHTAFFDEHDPDHERAVLEWRAVMVIMALQRIKNVKLDMIKIDFQNCNNAFLKAASDFRPDDEAMIDNTTWDFIYILCMDDTPLALLSPISLVCPAKSFKQRIEALDWLSIQKVNGIEKLLFNFPEGKEFASITTWLKKLKENLVLDKINKVSYQLNLVNNELSGFIKNISNESGTEDNTPPKENLYASMNSSIRKEYTFFNNCCDFIIEDPDMAFLAERYKSDIFLNKVLVVVYDKKTDAMSNRENIKKLDALFHNIVMVGDHKIIDLIEPGGERIPAYVLMPFTDSFVCELINHNIESEHLFEKYAAVYNSNLEVIEFVLQFKGFPYVSSKKYYKEQWQIAYAVDFESSYLWPRVQLNEEKWQAYFVYGDYEKKEIKMKVPGSAVQDVITPNISGRLQKEAFQLTKTKQYPSYLRYEYKQIGGYLPIQTRKLRLNGAGSTAKIFIDIGHSFTYLRIYKLYAESGEPYEELKFRFPVSLRVTGEEAALGNGRYNFVTPEPAFIKKRTDYIKNMLHNFQFYNHSINNGTIRPFEGGQALFDIPYGAKWIINNFVIFINFELIKMNQDQRRNAHVFIEQILLYIVFDVMLKQCSYLQVNFLHCYEDDDEKLGELEGLWRNAIDRVKEWTGIKERINSRIGQLNEFRALSYRLYLDLLQNHIEQTNGLRFDSNDIYVGVDIGWKKTIMAHIYKDSNLNEIQAQCSEILFAGRNISMINLLNKFRNYPGMLNILLNGSDIINNNLEGFLLKELKQYTKGSGTKNQEYYQGLFDVIAEKIEETGYIVPPDVYNNMDEFRTFLKMITYNILLLFLNIGYLLGKMQSILIANAAGANPSGANLSRVNQAGANQTNVDQAAGSEPENNEKESKDVDSKDADGGSNKVKRNVHIRLGGNGAKFLYWVSNLKDYKVIQKGNSHELFILKLKNSILDVIEQGYKILISNESIDCTICLADDIKGQLIEGYLFKELPEAFPYTNQLSDLPINGLSNTFYSQNQSNQQDGSNSQNAPSQTSPAFLNEIKAIKEDVFQDEYTMGENVYTDKMDLSEIIRSESGRICEEIIDKMNKM